MLRRAALRPLRNLPLSPVSSRLPRRSHCDNPFPPDAATVTFSFVSDREPQSPKPASGRAGENLLHVAHAAGVDLEGACACSLACSTCHVVLPPAVYAALPPPSPEEEDLLDLAFGLTPTSRLGCQVLLAAGKGMEGMQVRLPAATRNMYVDGFVPKPH